LARPRLSDDVKKARGTFRPSRALNTAPAERNWPRANPDYPDREVVDEAVTTLRSLYDKVTEQFIVDGCINPSLDEMQRVEQFCVNEGILLPTKMSKLLTMMAEGMLAN
jgi:hypothetical protein